VDTSTATTATRALADSALTGVHELRTLVLSRHPAIVLETAEEERADALLAEVARETNLIVFEWTITHGLTRRPGSEGVYGTQDPMQMLAAIPDLSVEGLFVLKDFGSQLATPAVSRTFRELLEQLGSPDRLSTIVLMGVSVDVPPEIAPEVVRYELRLPGRDEYRRVIADVVTSLQATGRADVRLEPGDLDAFTSALCGLTVNQARQALARVAIEDGALSAEDLDRVVEIKARALREGSMLEYFPPAGEGYELGGFDKLRRWLERARVAFSDEATALGIPAPKGVLLVGVQGCGKSLAAKVIARQWQQPLLKLDFSSLYAKYVGESEKNLRRALTSAEAMAPAVLWIDEIEKGLAPSGGQEADGGLSRRLFGSFLTWLQEKQAGVFVVATANDLSALPPELLRKGRFDEIFFVDLPTVEERAEILRIHLRLRKQDPASFDVDRIAVAAEGFSGAELEQAVSTSLLRALQDHEPLSTDLLVHELSETVPLSRARREDVERLRVLASERFVPVR
jgi:ATPase family associated with various cellular activities (AAA)